MITNDEEYTRALEALDEVFYSEPWTPGWDLADELTKAINNYESIHFTFDKYHEKKRPNDRMKTI